MVLANSNPATIMTDPAIADRTYVEPLDPDVLTAIIERERPDALLPTLGGQTALNLAMALSEPGVLDDLRGGGDRGQRRGHRHRRGPRPVQGGHGGDRPGRARARASPTRSTRPWPSGSRSASRIMVRPSFILGGAGTGIAPDRDAPDPAGRRGPRRHPGERGPDRARPSPGWKEFELEVMRDRADNCVVICSIENFDPMGVHTGDSITVAPAQTLTDVEYQAMRDAAFACIRRVGVETGRLQRPVRRGPDRRTPGGHRDEPPGLPLLGPGLQGHRVPHRQDRRPPGGRLPARRDPQRHHRRHPGQLRADHRLRGDQDPPVGLREAARRRRPRWAPGCSRWGRSWPSAAPSPSRCRRRSARWSRAAPASTATRPRRVDARAATTSCVAAAARGHPRAHLPARGGAAPRRHGRRGWPAATGIDPWFLDQMAAVTDARMALDLQVALGRRPGRPRPPGAGGGSSGSASPTPSSPTSVGDGVPEADVPGRPHRPLGCGRHLQDRRHLRRRVRGPHPVPLLHLRGRGRGGAVDRAHGDHPRLGAQPDRPGHRVRLLLRARLLRPARRRLRDGDGQLQPRDGLHRLRHLGPPLLRAPDRRGPGQRARRRAAGLGGGGAWSGSSSASGARPR